MHDLAFFFRAEAEDIDLQGVDLPLERFIRNFHAIMHGLPVHHIGRLGRERFEFLDVLHAQHVQLGGFLGHG